MMLNVCKISVIVPVHNVEKYLAQCLTSICQQTLSEIEIICVDDASDDSSAIILDEFQKADHRIRTFHFSEKRSALLARKKGVDMARGQYIMFLDADDYLELDACEILYEKIVSAGVEILHFSTKIENCSGADLHRIQMNENLLQPFEKKLYDKEIFENCFEHKKFGFTLWNKIYETELCKKAFEYMENTYMPKAQDLYSFFIISYFAKSYLGWSGKPCYHYCFGRGVTGRANISLNIFERYCCQAEVVHALIRFFDNQGISEKHRHIIDDYRKQWLKECVGLWYNDIHPNDSYASFELLCKHWGSESIISQIANSYWYSRDIIASKLKQFPQFSLRDRNIHTIALYYYHFTIGGIQRVISILIPLFQAMGYTVILITDKSPSKLDMPIPEDVKRVTVMDYQEVNKNNISNRLNAWDNIMESYSIDLVIYHAWTSPLLLWDMLYLKSRNVPVVVQTHSVFSFSLMNLSRDFSLLPPIMRLCDGMVVLSNADYTFWSCFNNNVYHIPNPILPTLFDVNPSTEEKNVILWIGRFSNEKQPWEAIRIMELVVKRVPDAILYMIGDASESSILEKYKVDVEKRNLSNNVFFLGYQENVFRYLEKSKISLITSTYEGFSMVLIEAQAHGVPTVMYDMPYLDIAKEEYGVIAVEPQNRIQAANNIVELLTDNTLWREKSSLAHQGFQQYSQYDYKAAWKNVFDGSAVVSAVDDDTKTMVQTIISHYAMGWKRRNQADMKSPSSSLLCSIGPIRKIYRGIRCYKENGMQYTLRRIKEKFLALIGR